MYGEAVRERASRLHDVMQRIGPTCYALIKKSIVYKERQCRGTNSLALWMLTNCPPLGRSGKMSEFSRIGSLAFLNDICLV